MFLAVQHFQYFLEGRYFTLQTDHKPLVAAVRSSKTCKLPRQCRQLAYISKFTCDVMHVAGEDNVVADTLSREVVNAAFAEHSIKYEEFAEAQDTDDTLQEFLKTDNSLQIEAKLLANPRVRLLGDVSTGRFRPFVPTSFRRKIFDICHALSHPSTRLTKKLISERYVWPLMNKQIAEWCRSCVACQQSKITRHQVNPLQSFAPPSAKFSSVHVDIVGPLHVSDGYSYILTVIDRFTRWPEAIPLQDIASKSCADTFLLKWVARFGAPSEIITDRGRQFVSTLWKEMCEFLGSQHMTTTA